MLGKLMAIQTFKDSKKPERRLPSTLILPPITSEKKMFIWQEEAVSPSGQSLIYLHLRVIISFSLLQVFLWVEQ